jgi:sugar phosphate isomerase/epimerase
MFIERRSFLKAGLAFGVGPMLAKTSGGFRIGVTDWNLKKSGQVEAVALAKSLGFEGVQISFGKPADGQLPLARPELQAQYIAEAKKNGIALCGTCLEILHGNHLKDNQLAQKWVADSIPATKNLKARVILLPFFNKGAMTTPAEMDYVGDVLKELAPEAEKAGVVLGLEDTNSAVENARIMDRAKSKAVQVYYDIGNSTLNGFEVIKEIRWLGKNRICQMHLKDNPGYLGEGKIDVPGVIRAMKDIGFAGWANLETDAPSKSVENDMRRNLAYVRGLLGEG